MDAVVLLGGQGLRLRPLTRTRHKSLVPLCNRPYMEYLLDWLERSGFERAILALGQSNEDLAHAYPPGRRGSLEIAVIVERHRLESGGAIRNAVALADVQGRFAVVNGDVYLDFDFSAALKRHVEAGADLTLALCEVPDPSQFGVAVVDDADRVIGFVEKPPPGTEPGNLVNAGVWIFEPGLVAEIPHGAVRVEETLFPSLVGHRRPVLGYRFQGLWNDIGLPGRYLEMNLSLIDSGCDAIAAGVQVAPDARVVRSVVGAGSHIGPAATITCSVLWENVAVGRRATVRDSILADGVHIGEGAIVDNAIIGHAAEVAAGARVPPGTSIEPGVRYHEPDAR